MSMSCPETAVRYSHQYMIRRQSFMDYWTCSSQIEVLMTERICETYTMVEIGLVISGAFEEKCQIYPALLRRRARSPTRTRRL